MVHVTTALPVSQGITTDSAELVPAPVVTSGDPDITVATVEVAASIEVAITAMVEAVTSTAIVREALHAMRAM